MSKLDAIFALYGAMDQLVVENPDRLDIRQTVERFLPGTTGPNSGWFAEITKMRARQVKKRMAARQFGMPATTPSEFPSLDGALEELAGRTVSTAYSLQEHAATVPDLNDFEYSRLAYAIGAISQLPDFPSKPSDDAYINALALPEYDLPRDELDRASDLLTILRADFWNRQQFSSVMSLAASPQRRLAPSKLISTKPPPFGTVKRVGDDYCARLATIFESPKIPVNKVKNVIDPRNWPKRNSFFCAMDPLHDDGTGWTRVLENVTTDCKQYEIKTALRYWKGQVGPVLLLNYALDADREATDDDFLVQVDNGCIQLTPINNDQGVRVYTTKEVRIDGLSVTATALWAGINGWAEVGETMLLDLDPDAPLTDMTPWLPESQKGPAWPPAAWSEKCDDRPPELPEGARSEVVSESVKMLTGNIDNLSREAADFADQWCNGDVGMSDIARFSATVGARLASAPWQFLDAAAKAVGRGRPDPDPRRRNPVERTER
jgi:hypothetical protein